MNPHRRLIVIANETPGAHAAGGDAYASGLVSAVAPVLAAYGGVWLGRRTRSETPAASARHPQQAFRVDALPLSLDEERQFYDSVCHAGLWPLCHRAGIPPLFDRQSWESYRAVNDRFAAAACVELAAEDGIVFVQNYHFALVPRLIRERVVDAHLAAFWHVPWPNVDRLEKCPWHAELLTGLLGSDVLGFQTPLDCYEFIESAEQLLGARIDREQGSVRVGVRETLVRDYPTSVEWPGRWADAGSPDGCRTHVRIALDLTADARIGVGVDRLEHAKGIPDKFVGIERLLEVDPTLQGRLVFVQLVEPGHAIVHSYRDERRRMLAVAERVNQRFGHDGYRPILVFEGRHPQTTIARYFRAADFCLVGSLHDGMNLESKSFVASRDDEQGVLVLSGYAGATCELADAVVVDPTDADDMAAGIAAALAMPPAEQRRRMRRMREVVQMHDAVHWGRTIIDDTITQAARHPVAAAPQ